MPISNILLPGTGSFSANDLYFKLQSSYSGDAFPDNYAIMVQIMMRPTPGSLDTYDELVLLECRPDEEGYVDFNISSIIDKAIRNRITEAPIPGSGQLQDPFLPQTTYEYAVNVAEREGTPPDIGEYTNVFEGYAILGGIDRTSFYRTYVDDIVAGSAKTIFSYNIPNRTVGRSQLQWLNWFNASGGDISANAEFKLYDENLTLIGTEVGSTVSVPAYNLASFPGLYSVNLGLLKPKLFTMQIMSGSAVSPLVKYVVDDEVYQNERHLIYLNSYTGLEGLRCTGDFDRDVEMDRQRSVAVDNVNGVATTKRELMQIGVDWNNVYIFRTGYITKQEREALDEMIVNNLGWEYRNDKMYSLDFLDNSVKVLDTGAMLDSIEFKCTDAVKKKIIPQETRV